MVPPSEASYSSYLLSGDGDSEWNFPLFYNRQPSGIVYLLQVFRDTHTFCALVETT